MNVNIILFLPLKRKPICMRFSNITCVSESREIWVLGSQFEYWFTPWNLTKQCGPLAGNVFPQSCFVGISTQRCIPQVPRHLYFALLLPQKAHYLLLSFGASNFIAKEYFPPLHFAPILRISSEPGIGRFDVSALLHDRLKLASRVLYFRIFSPESIAS